jgi:phage host-nuclease inhibitor protein Gam
MSEILKEIQAHKARLFEMISLLNLTSAANSDEMTPRIVLLTKEINQDRSRLYSVYSYQELQPFEEDILQLAKQISGKFEDIARNFKNTLADLKQEISSLQNKKKLNQYYR